MSGAGINNRIRENQNMKITLMNVRLSFSQLFSPKASGNGAPKYKANFILSEDSGVKIDGKVSKGVDDIKKAVLAACNAVMKEKFGKVPAKHVNWVLRDGADVIDSTTDEPYDGYGDGVLYIAASSQQDRPPQVVDTNPKVALAAIDNKIKDGDFVYAVIDVYAFDATNNQGGKGATAGLQIVQFFKKGEAFGASELDAEEELEDLGGEEEEENEAAGLM
jgi:hypothetical protein